MLVLGIPLDLNWFLQFIFTAFVIVFGLSYLVKNTASKYFEVDANFEGSDRNSMSGGRFDDAVCVVCGNSGTKICSRCKTVKYCSQTCQANHWKSGHKTECKDLGKENTMQTETTNCGYKTSNFGGKSFSAVALVPARGTSKPIKQSKKILFPYDEFVKLFNWDKPGFPPCGLLNCGNSCFANVVLQCLACTRPLLAYLLEKGHRRECRRNDWCFLCEFQTHVERASQNPHPFSPINILSRLPNIGGNLGYGRQEDAHELMRFAIDNMQSVCLDEFGGEKCVHPSSQETTLIQHIYGGHLQSQVICTKCNKISNQYENMMDLTVEIHGDAASLEECLDQFTVKEWLHGENMYKCDGCNDYVKASKRLTVRHAPNILTIALKRFQSGRFGKLNKRVTFPETLDLSPYMSESGDGTDLYKLYAVVVHVDMLNASFFGHYICYTKDFCGNWYRIDDCKVKCVELEEVLSQGAYMLLYSRVCARPSCLRTMEPSTKEEQQKAKAEAEGEPNLKAEDEWFTTTESVLPISNSGSLPLDGLSLSQFSNFEKESSIGISSNTVGAQLEDIDIVSFKSSSSASKDEYSCENGTIGINIEAVTEDPENKDGVNSESGQEGSSCDEDSFSVYNAEAVKENRDINLVDSQSFSSLSAAVSGCQKDSSVGICSEAAREDSEVIERDNTEPTSSVANDIKVYGNDHSDANGSASPLGNGHKPISGNFFSSSETSSPEFHNGIEFDNGKHQSSFCSYKVEDGMGAKIAEITNDS